MNPIQPDDVLAQTLRADARRMEPAFSWKLHEDTLAALSAVATRVPRAADKSHRSGRVFFRPIGFSLAALVAAALLVWLTQPNAKVPNAKPNTQSVAIAKSIGPKLTADDLGPVRFLDSPGELMTRSLTIAQQAISEQYAMTYASTVKSAQEGLPRFGFYSAPDTGTTPPH